MLPSGRYSNTGGSSFGGLSFRGDDARGYRKKGSFGKQFWAALPFLLVLVSVGLTVGLITTYSSVKHWKAEHAGLQQRYNMRGEDASRLQSLLSSERDTVRRQSAEIASWHQSHTSLQGEYAKQDDQHRLLQESHQEHQRKLDDLSAALSQAQTQLQQAEEAHKAQRHADSRRMEALQLQSTTHHRLWEELNRRLKAATAQHELKESEWNLLRADMEAQMVKEDKEKDGAVFTGGVDAAAALQPPVVASSQALSPPPPPQGPPLGAVDPDIAHLVSLLNALGIRNERIEPVIAEWVTKEQQVEQAHPGMEQPVQLEVARQLADLMRDNGIVTVGSSHEYLYQTLANYFSQGTNLQHMIGRRESPPGAATITGTTPPVQQGPGFDYLNVGGGRKDVHDRPEGEAPPTGEQQPPTDPSKIPRVSNSDRWAAYRARAAEQHRTKVDAAGFVA
ncbi:hypothetical protein WJX73_000531 [Symbiochloris irregularis]|uniref:Uncharacterized protein n=1 Tax=Symbiochloris irregularis TaxID=706552 RepID=A0AAW1NUH8_9CHLO